jgi:hypothetical protein
MENTNAMVTMMHYTGPPPLSPIYKNDPNPKEDGCFNENADKVPRVMETWSDTNLTHEYPPGYEFKQLICRNCRHTKFEVLSTDDYETSAKCCNCGMYYIVHSG